VPAATAAGSSTALAGSSSSSPRLREQQQEVLLAAVPGETGGAGRLTKLLVSHGSCPLVAFIVWCLGLGGGALCFFGVGMWAGGDVM